MIDACLNEKCDCETTQLQEWLSELPPKLAFTMYAWLYHGHGIAGLIKRGG